MHGTSSAMGTHAEQMREWYSLSRKDGNCFQFSLFGNGVLKLS